MTCPTCGTATTWLHWAAMEPWDYDGWTCANGHHWARHPTVPRGEPTPDAERTTAARTANATEEDQ